MGKNIQKSRPLPIPLIMTKNFLADDRFDIPNFASLMIICTDFYIIYLQELDPFVLHRCKNDFKYNILLINKNLNLLASDVFVNKFWIVVLTFFFKISAKTLLVTRYNNECCCIFVFLLWRHLHSPLWLARVFVSWNA